MLLRKASGSFDVFVYKFISQQDSSVGRSSEKYPEDG